MSTSKVELQQGDEAEMTEEMAFAARPGTQISPDCKYTIALGRDSKGNSFGQFVVYIIRSGCKLKFQDGSTYPGSAPSADTECWFDQVDWTKIKYNDYPSQITITKTTITRSENVYDTGDAKPGGATFSALCGESDQWAAAGTSPANPTSSNAAGTFYFENDPSKPSQVLTIATDGSSTTGVTWYRWAMAAPTGTISLTTASPWTVSVVTTQYTWGTNWYKKTSK